ncbi:hypothetical protein K2173_010505 [Erythroxylum novogranatense]|uniref:FAD-binding domain-containing protein n=1 Tax=Erythroxylum novogranatense TaxID=1862640 RepID=A0AAV8TF26_9ROSI|nr:hypothetical protein K2173_010505 [Erythroxylum novogranatense]
MEEIEILIVGGGICGLATAVALHRKGIKSVVLERSETLRAAGAGIAILTNGWRALDELGVASTLRQTSVSLQRVWDVDLESGKRRQSPVSVGEARCLKRRDLVKVLADDLPSGSIRFGCEIVSINLDSITSFPVLHLSNGSSLTAKVVIGCDGANSVVAEFLELRPQKMFSLSAVRGFTYYPNGHGLAPEFTRMKRGNILSGRTPVDDKLLFWFTLQKSNKKDSAVAKDPELVTQLSLESVTGYPIEWINMIKNCDLNSLSLTHLRYRAPWELLLGRFRRGTVAVAGDAMHVMGPFLGQGGSAAIEDAIVLARCLAPKMKKYVGQKEKGQKMLAMAEEIGQGLDEYVEERRMRLVGLSTQTYLFGSLVDTSYVIVKIFILLIFVVFFSNRIKHTKYDCGPL